MPGRLLPPRADYAAAQDVWSGENTDEWAHDPGFQMLRYTRINADHCRAQQYYHLAAQVHLVHDHHPDITELRTTGRTVDGRRVTPAVLTDAAVDIVARRWADAAMIPLTTALDAVREAVDLTTTALPALDALDEGDITGRQFDIIVRAAGALRLPTATIDQQLDETGRVTDLDITEGDPVHTGTALTTVERDYYTRALAEAADGLAGPALGRRCHRITQQLTPGYTAVHVKERDDTRHVEIAACDDGITTHVTYLVSTDRGARLDRWLNAAADAAADHATEHGLADDRTHAQRRHDVLMDALDHVMATGCPATSDPTAPAGPDDGPVTKRHHRPESSVSVHLTVAATTLLGLDEEMGEITGLGPVPAADARRLAGLTADVTWRKVVLDPGTRDVVDVGAKSYRPSPALRRWVTTTHPTCVAPGCAVPAIDCDLDHVIPYGHDGPTTVANLEPRCRRDHRHKTQYVQEETKAHHRRTRQRRARRAEFQRAQNTTTYGGYRHDDPPPY